MARHPRLFGWTVGSTAIAALVVMSLSPVPSAANWTAATWQQGECNIAGNITDNKDVFFDYIELSVDGTSATNWVRTDLLDPTSLNTALPAAPGTNVDVVMRDRYYTDWCEDAWGAWTTDGIYGVRGSAACYTVNGSGRCNQQVVRISTYFFDAHNYPGDRWIVCHEVGHAIGLRHRNVAGCMRDGVDTSERLYTSHDLGHINSNWSTEPAS